MTFQTPLTISQAIENISEGRYLLPAIQREFVWSTEKIEWLFDSLMRHYPISSFLFWNVRSDKVVGYRFYEFLREYRERFKIHNPESSIEGKQNFTAVLDGQQRLTSLYIGLKGSYAYKIRSSGIQWLDTEKSIPTRYLYLNITRQFEANEKEDGRLYNFSFLENRVTKKNDMHVDENQCKWFRVGKILDLANVAKFNRYITENQLEEDEMEILSRLQELVFVDRNINYFLEEEQDLHKALNIFIRTNSGGVNLDFSDLIMSIVVSDWEEKDARKEIHGLVDAIRKAKGHFSIEKDFILRVYLYLYNKNIQFKVKNFDSVTVKKFENDWGNVKDAIECTFNLVASFGYTNESLISKNALLPIVYYLYHREIYKKIKSSKEFENDRAIIKKWLHAVTLRQAFGRASNAALMQVRGAFTDDSELKVKIESSIEAFPANRINNKIKRDLAVDDEFIDSLLDTGKDDKYAFPILALLYPDLDYENGDFHKDHMHPKISFESDKNKESRDSTYSVEYYDSIVNLQLLDNKDNLSKGGDSLKVWFDERKKPEHRDRYIIPEDVNLDFDNFSDFYEKRKELLKSKLLEIIK